MQVAGWAEPGKAPPVTATVVLKGRTALLTPGAPGLNMARSLGDPARRAALAALAEAAMAGAETDLGLILRSAAGTADAEEIAGEIAALRADWEALEVAGTARELRSAPGAAAEARREWADARTTVREAPTRAGRGGGLGRGRSASPRPGPTRPRLYGGRADPGAWSQSTSTPAPTSRRRQR